MFEINLKNVFNKSTPKSSIDKPTYGQGEVPSYNKQKLIMEALNAIPASDTKARDEFLKKYANWIDPSRSTPFTPSKSIGLFKDSGIYKPPLPLDKPKSDQKYTIPEYPVARPNTPTRDLMYQSNPTDLNKPIGDVYTGPFTPPKSMGSFNPQVPSDISGPLKVQAMEKIGHIGNWKNPDTPNKVFDIGPITNASGSPGSPGSPGALTARKKKSTKPKSKRKVVRKVVKKITKKCKCKK